MADKITRCPKCATAFRISNAVLSSAKGLVRCGSCLTVFNAREHLEQPKKPSPPPLFDVAQSQETPLHDTSSLESFHYVKQDISQPVDTDQKESPLPFDQPTTRSPRDFPSFGLGNTSLFEREQTTSSHGEEMDHDDHDEDESWALALLNEDDDEPDIQIKKVAEPPDTEVVPESQDTEAPGLHDLDNLDDLSLSQPDENELETGLEEHLPPLHPEPNQGEQSPAPPAEEYEAPHTEQVPDDSEPELSTENHQATENHLAVHDKGVEVTEEPDSETEDQGHDSTAESRPSEVDDTSATESETAITHTAEQGEADDSVTDATPSSFTDHRPSADTESVESEIAQQKNEAPSPNIAAPGDSHTSAKPRPVEKYNARQAQQAKSEHAIKDVLANLEPEPLEVAWDGDAKTWRKRLFWSGLALIALVALLLQIAWLQFHRLNRIEPYRSFYAVACEVVGCELPELVDRSQISTSNLLVRTHPKAEDALQVDVILQNDAPFEQPFPSLLLQFSDLQNRPVASRKLLPKEYLGGELSGQDLMPTRQPIRITVEIVDPGKDAVSYSIAIVD